MYILDCGHFLLILINWFGYLLVQSLIINGIKLSSEGRKTTMPDGSIKVSEMIFAPIAHYLDQHEMISKYYSGAEFFKLHQKLKDQYPMLDQQISSLNKMVAVNEEQIIIWEKLKTQIQEKFEIEVDIYANHVVFSKRYPKYRFSKFIRKPIFGCIVCMSSFWGLWTCLVPALILFGPQPWVPAFYLANTASLAYLNKLIYRPL